MEIALELHYSEYIKTRKYLQHPKTNLKHWISATKSTRKNIYRTILLELLNLKLCSSTACYRVSAMWQHFTEIVSKKTSFYI